MVNINSNIKILVQALVQEIVIEFDSSEAKLKSSELSSTDALTLKSNITTCCTETLQEPMNSIFESSRYT